MILDELEYISITTYLDISGRELTVFPEGVSKLVHLEELSCEDNKLTEMCDVSKNRALKELDCSTNELTELDVSENLMLERLDCEFNELIKLVLPNALTRLNCHNNQLTELDLSKNLMLVRINLPKKLERLIFPKQANLLELFSKHKFDNLNKTKNWATDTDLVEWRDGVFSF